MHRRSARGSRRCGGARIALAMALGTAPGCTGPAPVETAPIPGTGSPGGAATVSDVVDRLERCTAVLVLDGGHPVGILTRADVLTFLASRAPT